MPRRLVEVPVVPLAYRVDEAAAALGVSTTTFNDLIRHELPVVRVGSVVMYPVYGLQGWLQSQAEQPISTQLRKAA